MTPSFSTACRPHSVFAWLLALLAWVIAAAVPAQERPGLEVQVEGVSGDVKKNVLGFLSIEQQKNYPLLTEGLIEYLHAKAPAEIRRALQPFGYYRPDIDASLTQTDSTWVALYRIDPGPPLKIADMDVVISGDGADDPEFQILANRLPIEEDDVLVHPQYEEAKQRMQQLAAERGYLDAAFEQSRVRVDLQAYEAYVVLHFDTGPRFHFGNVRFFQGILRDEFLQTFIPFQPGDPYSVTELLRLQKALSDSGYFARVEVRPRRNLATDHQVPIHVMLEPQERNRYAAGIGYGTNTGVRGQLSWQRRWVNRRGHRFSAAISGSEIHNDQTLNYVIPLHYYPADQVAFTAARVDEDTDTGRSLIHSVAASRSRSRGLWRQTLALNYRLEAFTVGEQDERSTLLMPSAEWSRIVANDPIYATRGSLFKFELRGATDSFISTTTFLQGQLTTKFIRRPLGRGRVILRGVAGASAASEFDQVPLSLRFFAGGDNSVRGYDYQELSPTDALGERIGGKNVLVGSLEYEQPVVNKWSVAGFYDVGNAFNELPFEARSGVGVGVRWRSPIGLVRLDLARGLDDPESPQRIHLVVGPDL